MLGFLYLASPLTGKLFDESGQSLTPSHAVKGERRYRYYVSRSPIKGTADSGGRGWRLPAPEIERAIAAAVLSILSDQTAIATTAHALGLAEHQLPSPLSVATVWMKRLQSEVEVGVALSTLVDRVDLIESGIRATGSSPKKPQIRMAQSGTILIREWQGNAHRVTMLDDGVSFNGKRYRARSGTQYNPGHSLMPG